MKNLAFLKVLIGFVLILVFSSASFAQRHNAEKQAKRLKVALKLSDEQAAKVQAATQKRMTQMEAVRDSSKENKKENMGKMKTTADEFNTEMKAILTPEQYIKFEEVREDKKEKMKDKRKQKRGNR